MFHIVSERASIAEIVQQWRVKMTVNAGESIAFPHLELWGRIGSEPTVTVGRTARFLSEFRVQAEITPRAVEINIPAETVDENVLGASAIDDRGRRWIIRQGWLRANGTLGAVGMREFPNLTRLNPVEVDPPPQNQDRRYYAVACIDGLAEEVQAETADFVRECDLVRRRQYGQLTTAEDRSRALEHGIQLTEGSPENHVSYLRGAADAQRILYLQARVWCALKSIVGARMHKINIAGCRLMP